MKYSSDDILYNYTQTQQEKADMQYCIFMDICCISTFFHNILHIYDIFWISVDMHKYAKICNFAY